MEILAIIPARGGSKGIPRKNVLPVAGKPLIAHNIAAALASLRVTRVIVSTDDAEIAAAARAHGAEVVMRPDALASDVARSEDALLHVLDTLEDAEGYRPDALALLQSTSPLTPPDDIDGTLTTLEEQNADSALAVVPFHYFLWSRGDDGSAEERMARLARARPVVNGRPEGDVLPGRIEALMMDFVGMLTDDRVFVSSAGEESVACSRSDGMGIELLSKAGLAMTVISKEQNAVVAARCRKLKLECSHGIDTKLPLSLHWLEEREIAPADAVYIGNDIIDLPCMEAAGCAVAPADAHPQAKAAAHIVLNANGGRGAIRELADMLIASGRIAAIGL
ncbi:acylneuraminate cytidylyltransferase [Croceicoccus marinus]|jgi:N-acylneuraminate cytidylyltransferase|uniref:N-acylneuraminate cytidylyltransferase n=1 Tax=Croceicoccus marinus TaxID=450378 RepID=A0A7G6VUY5_9SPHN|nr:acylneuraminate cytidylyltransferase [Croceicoccus marinus]QNE05550.1 acylneuraminate cytidylyltransferase [Croceicoccus marinus]